MAYSYKWQLGFHAMDLPFNVKMYGAKGDGVTNDTAAIQSAIDAAAAAGGGVIFFPAGHYIISGALQDTSARNAQLLLPNVSTANPQVTLVFKGEIHPPFAVSGDLPAPGGYSILESTITGGTGTAAVISGGNGTWPTKNNVCVVIEDLICLNHTNPSLTFWNRSITQGGGSRGLYITTPDWDLTPTTQPTNSNAYGMKLPQWGQSNGSQEEFMVGGHYTGFLQGELADVHAIIGQCRVGIELPFSEHPSKIHAHVTAGTTIINVTGENRATIWIDIEHYTAPTFPAWLVTANDLEDASNRLYGDITWFSLDGITQVPDHIFDVNGGANAQIREIGESINDSHTHTSTTLPAGLVGPILVADIPAGSPLVFADLLQNDDGDDLLYADI